MDVGEALGYALAGTRLAAALWDLWDRRPAREAPRPHPAPPQEGPDQAEEVDAVSARSIKIVVEVFPGRVSQTMKVRASGKRGPLLFGKVRKVAYRQSLTPGDTEELYVSAALTQAQALVLS